jgi:CRISPR/Cas system CMR subunit Cmr6 (Cas7 group RAMP superfamily)
MDEARRLHFAQVCADSFTTIRSVRGAWQQIADKPGAGPREKQQAKLYKLYLDDTRGLGARSSVVGACGRGKLMAYHGFVSGIRDHELLFAQLQSRLMLNMAGGVMENAGLCLDRFGWPYIPGSAVKGCARRAALAALHEWCETGQKPSGKDNLLTPACEDFESQAEMLATVARVFGWCEQDWSLAKKDGQFVSDFAWACGATSAEVWKAAVQKLNKDFGWSTPKERAPTPWEALPNFAGSVSFLPAYLVDFGKIGKVDGVPLEVPQLGKLELDVVTCHHREYYGEPAAPRGVPHSDPKWLRWKRDHDEWLGKWGTAPDTEEPNPVVFPAVAPGHVFAFALRRLRGGDPNRVLVLARAWLAAGLETFGLGAKTNAGYGWFDCRDEVQSAVRDALSALDRKRQENEKRKQDEERQRLEKEERRRKDAEIKAAMANMTPEQKADYGVAHLSDDQFRAKLDNFLKLKDATEKEAIVRALRFDPATQYSRRKSWDALKQKATEGGKPAQTEQAIRQLSKQMNLGKMP